MADARGKQQRVDEEAMRRLLAEEAASTAGLILCLAWTAGLSAAELCGIRWKDVSTERRELWLGERRVLLEAETVERLRRLAEEQVPAPTDFVLRTEARRRPLTETAVYQMVRQTLNREETLRGITLKKLRHDHRLRLQKKAEEAGRAEEEQEFALWKAVQAEGASAEGLAIWMLWQMGLRLQEIVNLTWDDVDLQGKKLRLPLREVSMGITLERLLRQAQQNKAQNDTHLHVLLTPRSRRPYDAARLSRSVAAVLERFGVELRPGEISRLYAKKQTEEQLLSLPGRCGGISRREAAKKLGLSSGAAYRRLLLLTEQGRLERIGAKYYPAGTTVSAEEIETVICAYLEQEQGASCRQVAARLGIEARQCRHILRRMELDGRVLKRDRQYHACTQK